MPERTSKGTDPSSPVPNCDVHQGDFAQMTRALGERVRQYRARRGMSRKVLSHLSGVSERYLAQLESGRANVSFHILWNLAQTMDTDVTDLLRERGLENPDLVLARRLLDALSPQEQSIAYALLRQRFDHGRTPATRIGLIGLRGGGKTTLGQIAAHHFGVPFLRLSQMVEEIAGMELAEIFVTMGQKGYRRLELKALQTAIAEHRHAIIETGGSLVSEPATFDVLLSSCFTIWVKAAAQDHMQRVVDQGDTRPLEGHLQQAMDDLTAILRARASFYGRADATLDTSNRTQTECGAELIALCAPYLIAVSP